MPRSVARFRRLLCHSCKREWSDLIWSYSDDFPDERRNVLTCTCPHPHIQVLPSLSDSMYATCRAEQRAAVYVMPDGRVITPSTNAYDDPEAVGAVQDGGYRYEFASVRDLRRFHEQHKRSDNDEFVERSRVLDWDKSSIDSGQFGRTDPVRQGVNAQHAAAIRRSVSAERRYPLDYYERTLAKHKARTGK